MPDNTPHVPTDITRAEVSALVSFGNTQEQIAGYIEIDIKTLQKYYRKELDNATMLANAQVAKRLYNKAVQQDDLSAQVFWLKTRARWRTSDREIQELADENDKVKAELYQLRAQLAEKNRKEY